MVKFTSLLATAAATTTTLLMAQPKVASCFTTTTTRARASTGRTVLGSSSSSESSSLPESSSDPATTTPGLPDPSITNNPTGPPSSGGGGGRGKSRMSESIPFLKCPAYLTGELAGDVGFDPLGLAGGTREGLLEMREAEIKHARLAMLAAAGWPLAELFDRRIAEYFDVPTVLDAADRVSFDRIVPEWWGFCLGLTATIDLYGVQKARSGDPTYFPGNLGWDPLNLYPDDKDKQRNMQLAEIKHGRLAMIAVAGFAAQEAISKVGVVDETPFFFKSVL